MPNSKMKFEILIDFNLAIGESPVWDERRGILWFVDVLSPAVLSLDLKTRKIVSFAMPADVGSISLASDARLVVALRTGVHLFDPGSGELQFLVHPEPDRTMNRLNDGKVGPDGCFWIGSMHDSVPRAPSGALYRVTPAGECRRVLDDIKVSNGLAWSPDGKTMYHADTRESSIKAFDFDAVSGALGQSRPLISLTEEQGLPDGAAVDELGFYWSAGVTSGRINKISPEGELVESIDLPVAAPTMPCFGGADGQTMFVTSLASDRAGRREPGTLLAFQSDAVGAPVALFGETPTMSRPRTMSSFRRRPNEAALDRRDKGAPALKNPVELSAIGAQDWRLLQEDLPLPIAVLKERALRHNSAWMKAFLNGGGAKIAPHGKTTMSPALFDLQLEDGAWGVTLSTPHQIQVARSFGYKRIFMANQLVGRSAIEYVLQELKDHSDFEFYCLVDSMANAEAIARVAARLALPRSVNVLVELGYVGGRTGCRTMEEALELAAWVSRSEKLSLSGIEGFEGLLRGATPEKTAALVSGFLDDLVVLAERCASRGLFSGETVLLSAGGSSFYDLVVAKLKTAKLDRPSVVLLRAGCYITHDSIMYVRAFDALRERDPRLAAMDGGLQAALEIWAYVQSRPEPTKVIVGFGKRDASYDDPPLALTWFRPGGAMHQPAPMPAGHEVVRLNDQHCHMSVPKDSPLAVGDMVSFGISHPCLTFDKWRVIHILDDDYRVTSSIRTYF